MAQDKPPLPRFIAIREPALLCFESRYWSQSVGVTRKIELNCKCFNENWSQASFGGDVLKYFCHYHEDIMDKDSKIALRCHDANAGNRQALNLGQLHLKWHNDDNSDRYKTAQNCVERMWYKEDYKGYISLEGCKLRKEMIR
eukprot:393120_1